jgi:hypothetical protein
MYTYVSIVLTELSISVPLILPDDPMSRPCNHRLQLLTCSRRRAPRPILGYTIRLRGALFIGHQRPLKFRKAKLGDNRMIPLPRFEIRRDPRSSALCISRTDSFEDLSYGC